MRPILTLLLGLVLALVSAGLTDSTPAATQGNLGEVDPEKWVVFMFYSHPPLGERIAKASQWKGN